MSTIGASVALVEEPAPTGENVVVEGSPANTNAVELPPMPEPARPPRGAKERLRLAAQKYLYEHGPLSDREAMFAAIGGRPDRVAVRRARRDAAALRRAAGIAEDVPDDLRVKVTDAAKDAFVKAYLDGISVRAASKTAGFSEATGSQVLKSRGIPIRSKSTIIDDHDSSSEMPLSKMGGAHSVLFVRARRATPSKDRARQQAELLRSLDPQMIKLIPRPSTLDPYCEAAARFQTERLKDTPAEIAAREKRREQIRIEHAVDREVRNATGSDVLIEGQILGIGAAAIFAGVDIGDILRASNDGALEFEWRSGKRLFWEDDLLEWRARPMKPDRRKMVL